MANWIGKHFQVRVQILLIIVFSSVLISSAEGETVTARFRVVIIPSVPEHDKVVGTYYREIIRPQIDLDIRGHQAIVNVIEDQNVLRDMPHTPDGQLTREGQHMLEALISQLQANIKLEHEVSSSHLDVFAIHVTHDDSDIAERLVNELCDNWRREKRREIDAYLMDFKKFYEREASRHHQRVHGLIETCNQFALSEEELSTITSTAIVELGVLMRLKHGNAQLDLIELEKQRAALGRRVEEEPLVQAELDAIDLKVKALERQIEILSHPWRDPANVQMALKETAREIQHWQNRYRDAREQAQYWDSKLRDLNTAFAVEFEQRGLQIRMLERGRSKIWFNPAP